MALTLTLLLTTLLVAALLVTALVPERVTVWLGCTTNVLQLHTLSILGIYPSFALLCWLAPWRSAFGSALWRWPWTHALLLLAAAQIVEPALVAAAVARRALPRLSVAAAARGAGTVPAGARTPRPWQKPVCVRC